MTERIRTWWRDWRRGYSDADVESLDLKLRGLSGHDHCEVTQSELRAYATGAWRKSVGLPHTH